MPGSAARGGDCVNEGAEGRVAKAGGALVRGGVLEDVRFYFI